MTIHVENKCKILIFLESHSDKGSGQAILDLFGYFQDRKYNSFLFEEPSDATYKNTIKAMKSTMESKLSMCFHHWLTMQKKAGDETNAQEMIDLLESQPYLSAHFKASKIGQQYHSVKESYTATIKLLKTIHNQPESKMHFVDLPMLQRLEFDKKYPYSSNKHLMNIKLRDEFMSGRAEEICLKGENSQVLLVGFKHYGIGNLLKQKGFEVKLFSVFVARPTSIEDLPPSISKFDKEDQLYLGKIRNSTAQELAKKSSILENLVLIDLYKHPELSSNYTDLILESLDHSLLGNYNLSDEF